MKKCLLIGAALIGGIGTAQIGAVGVETDTPTETLQVEGTARISDLPEHEKNEAIHTTPSGTASNEKDQFFKATRTVVVDENGVLGTVKGLPAVSAGKHTNEEGTEIYTPERRCAKNHIGDGGVTKKNPLYIDFKETGYRFSWYDEGTWGKVQVDVQRIGKYKNQKRKGKGTFWTPYSGSTGGDNGAPEISSEPTRLFDQSFKVSTASKYKLIIEETAQTFHIDVATINDKRSLFDEEKVMNICIEQTVF